ncbi:hypothetical protein PZ938_10995 [Luteipulveratus sp. YIM 133132]|uniref:hypothetical protein n=1 Tax=Luteipulveratus flavus TaxID=3031728 RepID=UPI0023AFD880|nr:hypothetical protein [Luteipulveratus sp. YIM 133132]MDE9366132.1 hypothetical protein [Luteipulveratus sp. YIM 133132]
MIATRRLRLAVIPAAFAALALAGCQDEAPTAAPPAAPTSQAPAATSSAPAPTAAPSTESPTSEAPAPAPSASTSASSAAGGVVCDSDSGDAILRAGMQGKPLGKQTVTGLGYSKDTSIDVTVGKPTIDSTSTDDYFPGDGMVTAQFPVTVELKAGSYFVTAPGQFGLVDGNDNICDRDISGTVVPRSKQIPIESLKSGDKFSGTIAFAVPAGADLKGYYVVFNDNNGGKAQATWTAS